MNKKKIILIFLAVIAVLAGIIAAYIFFNNKNNESVTSSNEGDVTRYEWIEMLCEETGMTQYENQTPYFQDVSESDPHFAGIQSAVEWELLDAASDFRGDEYASGDFIALTAMKTIGEHKVRFYLDTEDTLSDDVYTGLAVELGLIEKKDLQRGFSKEECETVLDKLREVYFGELWKDDTESVSYRENVLELAREDILQGNGDCSEIKVADGVLSEVSEGTVIVFEYGETGLKAARKVIGIEGDGKLLLSDDVELDEVLDSLVVSDITEVTVENILNYYGSSEGINPVDVRAGNGGRFAPAFSAQMQSKGFKISVETEEEGGKNVVSIKVTDNDSGTSYKLPVQKEVDADCKYQAEVDVDKILVATQIEYHWNTGLEYAEVALDTHTTFSGGISAEASAESERILLCETPVPLGSGIVGVKIQIYLVLSVEGSITLEAELPVAAGVRYEKGKGIRNFKSDISVKEPDLKVNCEAGLMLRGEITPVFLMLVDIIDAEADVGVAVSAEMIVRPISMVCIDASAAFPVITVSVCGDEDADTLVGALGLSGEWEIISSENAPVKFGLHYESLPDGSGQFVDECTYDENQEEEAGEDTENTEKPVQMNNTYYTRYKEETGIDRPVFCFDYPDGWTITQEQVDIESDDSYQYYCEVVELTNERGVRITYTQYNVHPGSIGQGSVFYYTVENEVKKVGDSSLKLPDTSNSEGLMVAKIKDCGGTDPEGDYFYSDDIFYALLLDDKEGSHTTDLPGQYAMCAFYYPERNSFQKESVDGVLYAIDPYTFIAESPDGEFTEEEEQEVIAILSSFRLANEDGSDM